MMQRDPQRHRILVELIADESKVEQQVKRLIAQKLKEQKNPQYSLVIDKRVRTRANANSLACGCVSVCLCLCVRLNLCLSQSLSLSLYLNLCVPFHAASPPPPPYQAMDDITKKAKAIAKAPWYKRMWTTQVNTHTRAHAHTHTHTHSLSLSLSASALPFNLWDDETWGGEPEFMPFLFLVVAWGGGAYVCACVCARDLLLFQSSLTLVL